jgi:trehalose-phosphatase
VLEVRPLGVHKGAVVLGYPGTPAAGRRDDSFVAIGDDRTDEDLFRAIRGRGLAVKIGPPRSPTLASQRLASPLAVRRFLSALGDLDRGSRV